MQSTDIIRNAIIANYGNNAWINLNNSLDGNLGEIITLLFYSDYSIIYLKELLDTNRKCYYCKIGLVDKCMCSNRQTFINTYARDMSEKSRVK